MKQFRGSQYWVDTKGVIYNTTTKRYLKHIHRTFTGNATALRAYVGLYINGKFTQLFVHRILAELYIPNPNNLPQINHIDGNPLNNDLSNLEWVTAKDNLIHALKTGLRNTKLNKELVAQIKDELAKGRTHAEIAKQFNVGKTIISKIRNNISWNF